MENMIGMWEASRGQKRPDTGDPFTQSDIVQGTLPKILEIAEHDIPLANVLDLSDVILHAEGPGAANGTPWLKSINWLTGTAYRNINALIATTMDLHGADGKAISRHIDLRLSGIAPGSLWIGMKIEPPENGLLPIDDHNPLEVILEQVSKLPEAIRFIDEEQVLPGINEIFPDPAMRDAELHALYRLTPSGNQHGIHTVNISTQAYSSAALGNRERVVLKNSLDKPKGVKKHGTFIGKVREADLDKTRIHLREVQNVGTIRCVIPEMTAEKSHLGKQVRVNGYYETDANDRPRLLYVEDMTPVGQENLKF